MTETDDNGTFSDADNNGTSAITKFDTYTRFKAIAASSSREEGLRLLAKLDALEANPPETL